VRAQDYPNLEHIVVDGGSRDGTVYLLRSYGDALRWVSEPDEGQTDALNKGFRMAYSEIIGWLNADDVYLPGALHEVARFFTEHPDVDWVYGDIDWIDAEGDILRVVHGQEFEFGAALLANPVNQQACFFRRRVLEKVGYLRSDLNYIMDYEFWLRLGRAAPGRYVPARWAAFRIMPGTKTTQHPEYFWLETLRIYDEIFADAGLPRSLQRLRMQAYARMYWLAGLSLARSGDVQAGCTHCITALDDFNLLDCDPEVALAWSVYVEQEEWRYPFAADWFEQLLAGIPAHLLAPQNFGRRSRATFYATRFFVEHRAGKSDVALRSALHALRNDYRWLRNSGFLSRGLDVTVGTASALRLRKILRRVASMKTQVATT